MRAASNGVLFLRHLLQPFLKEPIPVAICENAVTYRTIPVTVAKADNPTCPTCHGNTRIGHGDCGPRIGCDVETANRLLGSENIHHFPPVWNFRIVGECQTSCVAQEKQYRGSSGERMSEGQFRQPQSTERLEIGRRNFS